VTADQDPILGGQDVRLYEVGAKLDGFLQDIQAGNRSHDLQISAPDLASPVVPSLTKAKVAFLVGYLNRLKSCAFRTYFLVEAHDVQRRGQRLRTCAQKYCSALTRYAGSVSSG
jgi:hypothetical protein